MSLTPEERKKIQLANLKSWKPGQSGNPNGRPKGIKNWSTIVQDLLADEKLLKQMLSTSKNKPKFLEALPTNNAANAIVATMIVKSIGGDKQAAEWLRKTGFGDKMIHEMEDGFFQTKKLEVEVVKSDHKNERDSKS